VEPRAGQPVSFVRTTTEKGDAATKVREEESVPEPKLTDEGREFGKVKVCQCSSFIQQSVSEQEHRLLRDCSPFSYPR